MNFDELILERQSDRKYDAGRAVEEEKLMECITSAGQAPSACNAQPWKFIIVRDSALKAQVCGCAVSMGMNKFCADAPAVVALVLEKPNLTSKIGSVLKGKEYTLIDTGIVAYHFCLKASDIGLGTCMVGWFDEKKVKSLLGIPSSKRVPLLITVGYRAGDLRQKVRKKLPDIYSVDRY
ncbi:MAG: nitroreductase family protein [Prevotellaceae bacterium]|jgi:nitroreductase|nr:nitroreductase family protein [Prevotellaceae bacterium]